MGLISRNLPGVWSAVNPIYLCKRVIDNGRINVYDLRSSEQLNGVNLPNPAFASCRVQVSLQRIGEDRSANGSHQIPGRLG